jgi:ureidoacrylate peracid hydrolase
MSAPLSTRHAPVVPFRPSQTGVLVVDLQNDFCASEGALGRTGMGIQPLHAVIGNVNRLTRCLRDCGATIVFLQSIYADRNGRLRPPAMARHAQRRWNGRGAELPFLQQEHWGCELHPDVEVHASDIIVHKFAYNGFFHSRLGSTLRTANVRQVIVTGVTTDVCVLFTSQEAYQRGYDVMIFDDCVAAYDAERHRAALRVLDHAIAQVCTANGLLEAAHPACSPPS